MLLPSCPITQTRKLRLRNSKTLAPSSTAVAAAGEAHLFFLQWPFLMAGGTPGGSWDPEPSALAQGYLAEPSIWPLLPGTVRNTGGSGVTEVPSGHAQAAPQTLGQLATGHQLHVGSPATALKELGGI